MGDELRAVQHDQSCASCCLVSGHECCSCGQQSKCRDYSKQFNRQALLSASMIRQGRRYRHCQLRNSALEKGERTELRELMRSQKVTKVTKVSKKKGDI